jgi:hypothetical protein
VLVRKSTSNRTISIRFIVFIAGIIGKQILPTKVAFKAKAALSEIAYFLFNFILLGMLKLSGFTGKP